MKILAAVDGSVESVHAAEVALSLAHGHPADLTLVHASPAFSVAADWASGFPDPTAELATAGEAVLHDVKVHLGADAAEVRTMQCVGPTADVIARLAEAEAFEMVVVGSHRRGAMTRWVLGSVTDELVHSCRVPVLVVTERR